MGFINFLKNGIIWFGDLLASILSLGGLFRRPGGRMLRVVGYILLVLIIIGVALILPRLFPVKEGWLKKWIPKPEWYASYVWLLSWMALWLAYLIYGLLVARPIFGYEDIDLAWKRGMDALARAGVDIRDLPLFLVVGLTNKDVQAFFSAANIHNLAIAPQPFQNSPLHFYAHREVTSGGNLREAIFIACTEVGATSRQVELLGSYAEGRLAIPAAGGDSPVSEMTQRNAGFVPDTRTLKPGQIAQGLRETEVQSHVQPMRADELVECGERMSYLCELLKQYRRPLCSINGMLVAIPLPWTTGADKSGLDAAPQQDVQQLHRDLEMLFPVSVVFTGLDQVPGFAEFLERGTAVSPNLKYSNAGSKFSPGLAIDESMMGKLVGRSLEWFQLWVYQSFLQNLSDPTNKRLYRFLCQLERRRDRFRQCLINVLNRDDPDESTRLIGVYFASCNNAKAFQVFLSGVMSRLIEAADLVAWNSLAIRRYNRQMTLTAVSAVVAVALLLSGACLIWIPVFSGSSQ